MASSMTCLAVACPASRASSSRSTVAAANLRPAAFTAALRPRRSRASSAALRAQAVLTAEKADLDITKMTPMGDRVLVQPREQESTTAGGLLLAGSAKPSLGDGQVGTVLAVGPDVDIGVQKGDMVLFSKYGSSDVEGAGGEVCFVAQKSILAKLQTS